MAGKLSSYRYEELSNKLDVAGYNPLDVMLAGSTGAGKSTFINSLFGHPVAKVGTGVDPETQSIECYKLNDHFRIWDTPGLGDGIEVDEKHKSAIASLLNRTWETGLGTWEFIDLVLFVIEGANRNLGTCLSLLNEVIFQKIPPQRVLIVVNQADIAMKGRHWNKWNNTPNIELQKYHIEQAQSIKQRIEESVGKHINTPICFSAEYGYNMEKVYDLIIDRIPPKRKI